MVQESLPHSKLGIASLIIGILLFFFMLFGVSWKSLFLRANFPAPSLG